MAEQSRPSGCRDPTGQHQLGVFFCLHCIICIAWRFVKYITGTLSATNLWESCASIKRSGCTSERSWQQNGMLECSTFDHCKYVRSACSSALSCVQHYGHASPWSSEWRGYISLTTGHTRAVFRCRMGMLVHVLMVLSILKSSCTYMYSHN